MDKSAIAEWLGADERVLWAGQPRQGFLIQWSDLFLIPMTLVWLSFATLWELVVIAMVIQFGREQPVAFLFALFGMFFVCAGVYAFAGRFWLEARVRSRTFYAVTSKRIVIVHGGPQGQRYQPVACGVIGIGQPLRWSE